MNVERSERLLPFSKRTAIEKFVGIMEPVIAPTNIVMNGFCRSAIRMDLKAEWHGSFAERQKPFTTGVEYVFVSSRTFLSCIVC